MSRFTIDHNEGCGWVLKAPFTTNSAYIKFPKTFDALVQCFLNYSRNCPQYSYGIIQPCLHNRKEMKIVCLNGIPQYICASTSKRSSDGVNRKISSDPHTELFDFAHRAIRQYLKYCPYAIVDGLFRVDIMQRADESFVVNEFESFEAAYYSRDDRKEALVHSYLEKYWFDKLMYLCSEHVAYTVGLKFN